MLGINRSSLYYKRKGEKIDNVTLMNEIHDLYSQYPFMGYRKITIMLKRIGYVVNNKRVLRLMKVIGIAAIYPKLNLSKRRQKDMVYPYLLKINIILCPNDAWCVDITYIKLAIGFLYLVALIDVVSRKVMGWSLSPFLDTENCLQAFYMAIGFAVPGIVNSDQGCQFTSQIWIETLARYQIRISMDGKGRCLDNIYIERFWRSLKYEEVFLKSYDTVLEASRAIGAYIEFYNNVRPHQSLGYRTPNEVYWQLFQPMAAKVDNSSSSPQLLPRQQQSEIYNWKENSPQL